MAFPKSVEVRVGRFASRLPYPVNVNLPPFDRPDTRPIRNTGPELNIIIPQDPDRHTKLGIFMDILSLLESTLEYLLSKLLGIQLIEACLSFQKLGMRNAIELFNGLAKRKLLDADALSLITLTERLGRLNSRRNVLVHGHWIYEVNVVVRGGQAVLLCQFLRAVTPTEPVVGKAAANPRNQKERIKYYFTLKRIDSTTRETDTLNSNLLLFCDKMRFNTFEIPVSDVVDRLLLSQPYRVVLEP
jgi:hypothetical protein